VEYRTIGSSDLVVSAVGLGWGGDLFDQPEAALDAAVNAGITFFDVAIRYAETSEPFLADALDGRREDFVVAACVDWFDEDEDVAPGSREDIRQIELALERLRTDYVDLFYYAPPSDYRYWVRQLDGPGLADTIGAMQELVDEGKARTLALAGLTGEHLGELDDLARTAWGLPIVALKGELNILHRMAEIGPFSLWPSAAEHEVLPFCDRHGIGFLPVNPLASDLLTGQYRRGERAYSDTRFGPRRIPEDVHDRIERLERFAAERGHTLPELAVAALVSMGFPTVVAHIQPPMEVDGIDFATWRTAPEQVRAHVAAAEWELTPEELGELALIA